VAQLAKAPVSKTGDSRFESWLPRFSDLACGAGFPQQGAHCARPLAADSIERNQFDKAQLGDRPHPGVVIAPIALAQRSPTPAAFATSKFFPTQRLADQPEHRRPEANEEGSAFRVPPFVLADGLCANPEDDAKQDGPDREHIEVMTSRPQPARFRK
jgi:hypothetical protein